MAENIKVQITQLNKFNYFVCIYKIELLLIKENIWNVVHQQDNTKD